LRGPCGPLQERLGASAIEGVPNHAGPSFFPRTARAQRLRKPWPNTTWRAPRSPPRATASPTRSCSPRRHGATTRRTTVSGSLCHNVGVCFKHIHCLGALAGLHCGSSSSSCGSSSAQGAASASTPAHAPAHPPLSPQRHAHPPGAPLCQQLQAVPRGVRGRTGRPARVGLGQAQGQAAA
jgi:hypothetical protein